MTQNVYGPPQLSIFEAKNYQGTYVSMNDLNEIVFSYAQKVNKKRWSAYWVPVRRSTILQLVATMDVPKAVAITMESSVGVFATFTFDASKNVNTLPLTVTIASGAADGWVRMVVDPGNNTGGMNLAVMLRFLEVT